MRLTLIIATLLLCTSELGAQKRPDVQMFQPRALLSAYDAEKLVAVELGEGETRVVIHPLEWEIPAATYASDEADGHHALLRIEQQGEELVLVFEALPQTTRLLDIVFEGTSRRWMGIHSGARALQLPTLNPRFDESAVVSSDMEEILRVNALTELLSSDSVYAAISRQLPAFRDYVVWKWKLNAHQAFLLRKGQKRPTPDPSRQGGASSGLKEGGAQPLPSLKRGVGGGSSSSLRTLPRAPKPTRKELRRFSKIEQKMLQERLSP